MSPHRRPAKRSALAPRTSYIKRNTKPKPRNRKRHTREWLRAYGSAERVAWIQQQGCVICGCRPCENAHVGNGGMGRKADYTSIVPLCPSAHYLYHSDGRAAMEAKFGIDFDYLARRTHERWLMESANVA